MKESHIDPATLRDLFRYDDTAGKLYWRPRTHAASTRTLNMWNTRYAGKEFGAVSVHGYRIGGIFGTNSPAHRVIYALKTGQWPRGEIDHIDGDRLNNKMSNLRDVDRSGNQRNASMRSDNTSGHPGVAWHSRDKKWIAQIWVDGRNVSLGYYDDIQEAINARREANEKFGYHPNHGKAAMNESHAFSAEVEAWSDGPCTD